MKSINRGLTLRRGLGGSALFTLGIFTILGSGGNGGSGEATPAGTPPTRLTTYNFTTANASAAAQAGAATLSFFADFSRLGHTVLTTLATADPANSPFTLNLCTNTGSAQLSWIDSDHNSALSIGDSAVLQLRRCDLDGGGNTVSGNTKLGITSIDNDPLPTGIGLNVGVNLVETAGEVSISYIANFAALATTPDNIAYSYTYTANDTSSQLLTLRKNGSALYDFGCFAVSEDFNIANAAGTYQQQAAGVIKTAEAVLSLAKGSTLSFIDTQADSGTLHLLSQAQPPCATLSLPTDINAGSDGSSLVVEALGGDKVRLHVNDATRVERGSLDTRWQALTL